MDHITHEMRLANWKSIIEQCDAEIVGDGSVPVTNVDME